MLEAGWQSERMHKLKYYGSNGLGQQDRVVELHTGVTELEVIRRSVAFAVGCIILV